MAQAHRGLIACLAAGLSGIVRAHERSDSPPGLSFMSTAPPRAGRPLTSLLPALALLGLAGLAMRIPILATPPLLPLIREDLGMSEAQIGALVGLPLALFALAAVPGSLLVARLGAGATLLAGLFIVAAASGARGLTSGVWPLYLATIFTGLGVAVMQPAVPRLVREWVPERIGLGTAIYTNGMMTGALTPIALTSVLVMPLVGYSWRADLLVWAAPVLLIAVIMTGALPMLPRGKATAERLPDRWWPDWRSGRTWMLGLTFGSNNSLYYALSAVLPEFLSHGGRGHLIGGALLWLNMGQIVALALLLLLADRMLHRAWPYLVFGLCGLVGVVALAYADGAWLIAASGVVGVASAVTFGTTLALPPSLSRPDDVHRTAAGMFTIGYTCAVVVPIVCGALWDHLGLPRAAFVPIAVCTLGLTILGSAMSRYRPPTAGATPT